MAQYKTMAEMPLMHPCIVEKLNGENVLRFMDLGFFQGSRVIPYYRCMHGGTRVYWVKGTLIALRDTDATQIQAREAE